MAVSGWTRIAFIAINFVFWLLGLFVFIFIWWTLGTNSALSEFFSGAFLLSYTLVAVGAVILVIGVIGCIGAIIESQCLLQTYVGLVTTLLFLEIAGVVAAYVQKGRLPEYTRSGWNEFNQETRNFLQTQLQCCGFDNYTSYNATLDTLVDSCFKLPDSGTVVTKTNTTLLQDGCYIKITGWLNSNIPKWASVAAAVAFVQILCLVSSCLVLNRVHEANRVSDGSQRPLPISKLNTGHGNHVYPAGLSRKKERF
ncbi:CD63 antigen-like [Gigantopelta aegis]|uniref:CD63 antigen-like n=1 Tax=Gigantopelta aegis TaxID=1735272 RepID=UPI001B88A470|nr:CD63 antigen-like [Gigantopelta aegis]